jgi:flagellar motility protein MotE (MotC chaperone)
VSVKKITARIRILPITIFAAALMLTVKVSDIFDGLESGLPRLPVAPAVAQQAAPKPPAPQPTAATPPAKNPAKENAAQPPAAASEDRTGLDDPTLFTQSEIDLLQQLADRREKLEQRGRELDRREALLTAAETRIDKKIEELRGLEKTIEGLVKKHDAQEEANMQSLVKIYENMKPKDAARIFEQLDLDTLLEVAERMKERKLAPVMAKMDPEKAKQVTVELSRLRRIPVAQNGKGG